MGRLRDQKGENIMKVFIFIASTLLFLGSTTLAFAESIESHCKRSMGGNATSIKMCIENETKAKNELESMSIELGIKSYCERNAGGSYTILQACVTHQQDIQSRVSKRQIDPSILAHCKKIVGDSVSLLESCINEASKKP